MKISKKGLDVIKKYEGLKLNAYLCPAGVPTIGYGHTRDVQLGETITEEEANDLLRSDVRRFEKGVDRLVRVNIFQGMFDALVSFSFNVGLGALERSTLLRKLNAEDYQGAAREFPRWNKAGGRVLKGLTKRRKEEQQIFLGGPIL